MIKIKAIAWLVGIGAIVALGGWWYVSNLQLENEILTANNLNQSIALDEMEQTVAKREEMIKEHRRQVAKKQKQLINLKQLNTRLTDELSNETQEIRDCLAIVPSDNFVNSLRNYSQGQDSTQD